MTQGSTSLHRTGIGMSYEFSSGGLGALLASTQPVKIPTLTVFKPAAPTLVAPTLASIAPAMSLLDRSAPLPATISPVTMPATEKSIISAPGIVLPGQVQPVPQTIEKATVDFAMSEALKAIPVSQMPMPAVAPATIKPVLVPTPATPPVLMPAPVQIKSVPTLFTPPTLTPVKASSQIESVLMPVPSYAVQQTAAIELAKAAEAARIAEAEAARKAAEQAAAAAVALAKLKDQQAADAAAKYAEMLKTMALQAELSAKAAEEVRIKEQQIAADAAKAMSAEAVRLKDEAYKANQQVEALQTSSKDMQAKIDELNRQLYTQVQTPQEAAVIQDQVAALTENVAITESQIPAAEAQADSTAAAAQDMTQQAAILDISSGQSWFAKNRTLVVLFGLGVIGVGYWYYKRNQAMQQAPVQGSGF